MTGSAGANRDSGPRRMTADDRVTGREEFATRRIGRQDEVAATVLFLSREDCTLCQGAILPVDGGFVDR